MFTQHKREQNRLVIQQYQHEWMMAQREAGTNEIPPRIPENNSVESVGEENPIETPTENPNNEEPNEESQVQETIIEIEEEKEEEPGTDNNFDEAPRYAV